MATVEITKSHHLSVGRVLSCVDRYFPSDHRLNAKATDMTVGNPYLRPCVKTSPEELPRSYRNTETE